MSESKTAVTPAARDRMVAVLQDIWGKAIGIGTDEVDVHTSFLELGADSLCLLQVSQAIRNRLDFKIPFRAMLDEHTNVHDLAEHILQNMPAGGPAAEELTRDEAREEPPPPAAVAAPAAVVQPPAAPSSPPVAPPPPAPVAPPQVFAEAPAPPPRVVSGGGLEQLFAQQLHIITQQLDVLRRRGASHAPAAPASLASAPQVAPSEPSESPQAAALPAATTTAPTAASTPTAPATTAPTPSAMTTPAAEQAPPTSSRRKIEPETFVPYKSPKSSLGGELTPQQAEHLAALVGRMTARMSVAREHVQEHRPYLADSRTVAGFRTLWKEMHYPLVVERGEGARLWDVDGNEYVDLTSGFGSLLFGHSPSFVMDALREQTQRGLQIGARSTYTGEAARMLCEMTGVERVQFCNSGTEAVMIALRLARVVTGRDRVALFTGSYHGTFDGVMVRGQRGADGSLRALPLAPGIPEHMIGNVLLLDMNDADCLERLRRHAHELAAVMIEPRQSRRPDVDLGDFLRELRAVADESGAALIFDEVVTGFRFHAGGSKALFGVQADLITYGKAMAGGLPVAAVGGKAAYMDAVDGGMWRYGDASYPEAETTFVAGTYFMHPLLMPVVCEVLRYLRDRGPELQERMRRQTTRIATELNAYFEAHDYPLRIAHFQSLFRFFFAREVKYADLFYYHLLEKGVFVCETRGCILSTAHTDEDLDHVIRAVKETVVEMRAGGFLPELSADTAGGGGEGKGAGAGAGAGNGAGAGADKGEGAETLTLPVTEAQKGIWALAQMGEGAARAYHQSFSVRVSGELDVERMRRAVQQVVNRHDALRTTFSPDGERQHVHAVMAVETPLSDLSHLAGDGRDAEVARRIEDELDRPFDLTRGPLVRAAILKLDGATHLLVVTIHHIVTDGWSNSIIQRDLAAAYASPDGSLRALPEPMQFSDYARRQTADSGAEAEAAEAYWLGRFAGGVPAPLELPTDRPRPPLKTFAGGRHSFPFDAGLYADLKRASARNGSTLLMTLLAGYGALLHKLAGQDDIVIGLHLAGQLTEGGQDLVGHCVNLLPLRSRLAGDPTFQELLGEVKRSVLEAHKHQHYSLHRLVRTLGLPRDASRLPLVTVTFNLDVAADITGAGEAAAGDGANGNGAPAGSEPSVEVEPNPPGFVQWDLALNVIDTGRGAVAELDFNSDLFDQQTVRRWASDYEALMRAAAARPGARLSELFAALDLIGRQQLGRKRDELKQNFQNIRRKAIHG